MAKINSAWTAVRNTSWGTKHVASHGDAPGFVICTKVSGQLTCIASVQPYFKQDPDEVKRYAELIANVPVLRKIVRHLADLNPDHINLDEVQELIEMARDNL
jgi:hypothetical protein